MVDGINATVAPMTATPPSAAFRLYARVIFAGVCANTTVYSKRRANGHHAEQTLTAPL